MLASACSRKIRVHLLRSRALLAVAVCAWLGACGDDGDGGVDAGADAGASAFAPIYDGIIRGGCDCHTAPAEHVTGLAMRTRAEAYERLVNVPARGTSAITACADTGLDRVEPGDAMASVIYRKVSGEMLCGSRMPLGGTPLNTTQIAAIRDWINSGAMP